jgi:DNA-binding NarL/FixJ family response regulator
MVEPKADQAIRLMVVDDHPVLRLGISAILEGQPDMVLVAEATNGADAVEQHRSHRPDVTLMDLQMPRMNGVEAIIEIRKEFANARIIVLTTYAGDAQAMRALKAGAVGYLLKSTVRRDLLDTIRAIHSGRRHIPAEIAVEIALHASDEALSEREITVLGYVGSGKANKEIAWLLSISEDTVKAHMRNIFAKLDVNDRTQAVTAALRRGIIEL